MINEIKIMLLVHLHYYYQRTASTSMQLDQHAGEAFQSVSVSAKLDKMAMFSVKTYKNLTGNDLITELI